ncbi:alpha/beta fold hydrolase [Terrisporobacter sp.]
MIKINYKIIGNKKVDIVIELGLGTCMDEWLHIAKKFSKEHGILLYERIGINNSSLSENKRTPLNIAHELYELLENIYHKEKIIIIAHSQGGLYAQQFARLYPNMIRGLILLDPLSANDNKFKEELSEEEYMKSGIDKSSNFKMMCNLPKEALKNLPPFCYYKNFTPKCENNILNSMIKENHWQTALDEYIESHKEENLQDLKEKDNFPNVPLVLITHTSDLAIEENIAFGQNSREFATKIETMWQNLMKEYLSFSNKSYFIQANHSSHYIHLSEVNLIHKAVDLIISNS